MDRGQGGRGARRGVGKVPWTPEARAETQGGVRRQPCSLYHRMGEGALLNGGRKEGALGRLWLPRMDSGPKTKEEKKKWLLLPKQSQLCAPRLNYYPCGSSSTCPSWEPLHA